MSDTREGPQDSYTRADVADILRAVREALTGNTPRDQENIEAWERWYLKGKAGQENLLKKRKAP